MVTEKLACFIIKSVQQKEPIRFIISVKIHFLTKDV